MCEPKQGLGCMQRGLGWGLMSASTCRHLCTLAAPHAARAHP